MTDKFQRSESDVLNRAPILVTLGDKQYPLKPLTLNKATAWRASFDEEMQVIVREFENVGGEIPKSLTAALIAFPEKIAKMVFMYDSELPQDEIRDNATEEQMAFAFGRMMLLAYPFIAHLGAVSQVIKAKANQ